MHDFNDEYIDHVSVLENEVLEYSGVSSGPLQFLDMTFGKGGHSFSLLNNFPNLKITAIDQDIEAVKNGFQRIKEAKVFERIQLYHMNFSSFSNFHFELENLYQKEVRFDGVLMDLGVSNHQLMNTKRGFSFRGDALLDMRMDVYNVFQKPASYYVNNFNSEQLADVFIKYSDERFAKRIAEKIVEVRKKNKIKTTKELEDIIFHCYPKKMRFGSKHPATKTFQALRILVNNELGVVEETIKKVVSLLNEGGRLLIISFHSIEDRLVKHTFKKISREYEGYSILTKKPLVPTEEELARNKKARSAKLRVLERVSL